MLLVLLVWGLHFESGWIRGITCQGSSQLVEQGPSMSESLVELVKVAGYTGPTPTGLDQLFWRRTYNSISNTFPSDFYVAKVCEHSN